MTNLSQEPKLFLCSGDVFKLENNSPAYLGHGVNIQGNMGGGIARVLADRILDLENQYRKDCQFHNNTSKLFLGGASLLLGNNTYFTHSDNLCIVNMFTQKLAGAFAYEGHIFSCMNAFIKEKVNPFVRTKLYLPLIGAGIGGLDEEKVIIAIATSLFLSEWSDDANLDVFLVTSFKHDEMVQPYLEMGKSNCNEILRGILDGNINLSV